VKQNNKKKTEENNRKKILIKIDESLMGDHNWHYILLIDMLMVNKQKSE